ncbi:MAG TPA: NAD(P)-dependent oxidoreductase [Amycolatopsis sp.]|nr:NAD(P)-dependent oxidoreductase [Amycolatopsis sp.]
MNAHSTGGDVSITGSGHRILVTGGSGAIGQLVVRRLIEFGARPTIFDVSTKLPFLSDLDGRFDVVTGDVTDVDALETAMREHGTTEVVHLAKLIAAAEKSPLDAVRVNVLGSACVLEAARRADIRRVVQTSTKYVYACFGPEHGAPTYQPITEDYPKFEVPDDPGNPMYSTTNKMAEYFGVRFVRKYDMELVVVRFAHTWGPGKASTRPKVVREGEFRSAGTMASQLVEAAYRGEPYEISEGGDEADDFVYNADLADGVSRAALSDRIAFQKGWREFHFGSGRISTLNEFVDAVAEHFPQADIKVGGGDLGRYSMNVVLLDNARAATELGYVPQYPPAGAVAHYVALLRATE